MKETVKIVIGLFIWLTACLPTLGLAEIPLRHWRQVASPADLGWSVEKLRAARAFSESIDTTAVMIIQDGVVVDQWGETALPLNCHSVRKSLLSALYRVCLRQRT